MINWNNEMNLNENMFARLSEASRKLTEGDPSAATIAIQDALKGLSNLNGGAGSGTGAPTMKGFNFMRAAGFNSAAMPEPRVETMPSFVSDLLERLGVGSALEGAAVGESLWDAPSPLHDADEKAKSAGQFLTKSFTNHAGTRNYKVYIPSSYHGQAMPLMVMLHGCTQDPDDFAAGTRMNAIAEETQCLVVYPAQAHSANSSKCWNWFNTVDQKRGQGEPSIIAGITHEVIHTYKLNDQPVYVAGLSSGGAMAIIMGTTYPDLYTAVGVHSGLPYAAARDLPSALAAMKGQGGANKRHNKPKSDPSSHLKSIPIIVFHGDRDTTVNPSNGDQLMEQTVSDMRNASSGTARPIASDVLVECGRIPNGHAYTCTSHHDVTGHAVAEHWVIHGAGHAWAGGSRSGTYTDPKGPDATREMMRFFYTHPQSK